MRTSCSAAACAAALVRLVDPAQREFLQRARHQRRVLAAGRIEPFVERVGAERKAVEQALGMAVEQRGGLRGGQRLAAQDAARQAAHLQPVAVDLRGLLQPQRVCIAGHEGQPQAPVQLVQQPPQPRAADRLGSVGPQQRGRAAARKASACVGQPGDERECVFQRERDGAAVDRDGRVAVQPQLDHGGGEECSTVLMEANLPSPCAACRWAAVKVGRDRFPALSHEWERDTMAP